MALPRPQELSLLLLYLVPMPYVILLEGENKRWIWGAGSMEVGWRLPRRARCSRALTPNIFFTGLVWMNKSFQWIVILSLSSRGVLEGGLGGG